MNSRRIHTSAQFLAPGCVSSLGVILTAIHAWHILSHSKPFLATLVGAVIPLILATSLVAVGYWTAKHTHRFDRLSRLCIWTYGGALIMSGMSGLIILHQYLTGALMQDSLYILANAATGGSLGGVLIGMYETNNHRRTRRIEALHTATRDLLTASTKEEVCERAVRIARETLDMPLNSIWLYDHEIDSLKPVATTEQGRTRIGDPPVYTEGSSISWEVYESGEPRVFSDVSSQPDAYNSNTPVKSEMVLPLGEHGVFNIGSLREDAFDHIDVLAAEVLAGTTRSVLDRADREERLRKQQEDLEQQAAQLDEFASVVSHDLRNPISVATGYLELAEETGDEAHFEKVEDALTRMETIIQDMLWLAREGQQIGELEAVDLAELARGAWEYVETGEATLHCTCDWYVCSDPDRLQQLFENLFRNAVEHGGDSVTVTVGTLDNGFYVEDTGTGIPSDEHDRIFEAGYSTGEDGTGYGLSIVKSIVDAHDWEIHATNGSEGGARFEITDVEQVTNDCCVSSTTNEAPAEW